MTKNTEKQKGITLVALIITIIVMIILVAVTLNIALGENGLIGKTKTARMKQEEQSILEEIIALATWDKNGNIETNETYERVKDKFEIEDVDNSSNEIKFKVQGKYGKYGYKISKTEITLDNTEVVVGEDYYFTFNQIKNYMEDFLANYNATAPDDEKMTSEQMWQMLIQTTDIMDNGNPDNATGIMMGDGIPFWNGAFSKSFIGQYGVNTKGVLKSESKDFEYSDFSSEEAVDKESKYLIAFWSEGEQTIIMVSKSGKNLGLAYSYDGNDENGNDETNSIMSWQEFLDTYGDTKFYFDGSKSKKESYAIKIYGNNLVSDDDAIAYKGENFEYTFVANEGYMLPKTIEVTIGDKTLEQGKDYTWDSTTGKFYIEEVSENIEIRVEAKTMTPSIYGFYRTDFGNSWSDTVQVGSEYKHTVELIENYTFPSTILVKKGNYDGAEKLVEGTDYTWDSTTGTVTIFRVEDSLYIEVHGLRQGDQVHTFLFNCTKENENDTNVNTGELYTNKIIADNGYVLPKKIRMVEEYWYNDQMLQEGIDYSWNSETGEITIFNPTIYIKVYIEARKEDLKYVSYDNKLWAVLYEENELGVGTTAQLISMNSLEKFELELDKINYKTEIKDIDGDGELELEKSIYISNNALEIFNEACSNITKNTKGITKQIRSYGTDPIDPNKDVDLLKNIDENVPEWYLKSYGEYGKGDNQEIQSKDENKIKNIGVQIVDDFCKEELVNVWNAVRVVGIYDSSIDFMFAPYCFDGRYNLSTIWRIYEDGTNENFKYWSWTNYLRPIIILEKGALDNALGGTGTIDDPIRLD